jgi:hypothetical protein
VKAAERLLGDGRTRQAGCGEEHLRLTISKGDCVVELRLLNYLIKDVVYKMNGVKMEVSHKM